METESFSSAAGAFLDLVGRIGPEQWERPGLGSWTVRSLVGHTARAILTVEQYLLAAAPAAVTVADAEMYYLAVFTEYTDNDAVAARGVEAGAALADDPLLSLTGALDSALAVLAAQPPGRRVAVGTLAMSLGEYLRTRVFELVVHSMDIAKATGLEHRLPTSVIAEAAALAAAVGARRGSGQEVLFALTGRGVLPEGFSVL